MNKYYKYSETNPVPGKRVKHNYPQRAKKTLKELFERRFEVKNKDDCWEWNGRIDKHGYGRFSHKTKHSELAHRVSYRLYVNNEIKGIVIRHKCDNPKCVNYNHLLAGTHKENTADMIERDRGFLKSGENNPFSKLTQAQALEILKSNLPQKQLAEIYNVSSGAINHIKRRSTWKHLII